jgi:hypothetical protein
MLLLRFMLMISFSLVFIQASQATEQIKAVAKDKAAHQEIEAAKVDDVGKIVDDLFTVEGNGRNDWFDLKNAVQGPYGSADFK